MSQLQILLVILLFSAFYGLYGAWACRHNREDALDFLEEFVILTAYTAAALIGFWGVIASVLYIVS